MELKAFVTSEAMDVAMVKVEKEVATSQEGITIKEAEEVGIGETTNVETLKAAPKEPEMVEVLEDTNAYWTFFSFFFLYV